MEACEVVKLLIYKVVVPAKPKRSGNPWIQTSQTTQSVSIHYTKSLNNDTQTVKHLKKQPWTTKTLRTTTIPDRTTINR
ncbi:MAG: hypothetical protein WDA42_02870 [Candidatus Bathyarchaeia archaeon]